MYNASTTILMQMPERPSNGLDDSDLMASMVKRLAAVEKELKEKNAQLARSQAEVEALKSKVRPGQSVDAVWSSMCAANCASEGLQSKLCAVSLLFAAQGRR